MAWDRTQRPRPPRLRAENRHVPPLGGGGEHYLVPPCPLSDADLEEILSIVPRPIIPTAMRYCVIEFTRHYLYDRMAAEPPRGETRHQLRMIAHVAWRLESGHDRVLPLRNQLARMLTDCNREARRLMREAIRQITGDPEKPDYVYFYRDFIDSNLIGRAALAAEKGMKGRGDYANQALAIAVQRLALVYDCCTGITPTFSRKLAGEIGFEGGVTSIAASNFGEFVLAIFRRIDPSLRETQVTNAIERELGRRRTHLRCNPSDWGGVPNLM